MIVEAITLFFTLEVLLACLIGVCVGIIVGALPGLSATMAVALLVPFTFGMSAVAGLVLLVSVYAASIYGGLFTAITLAVPGTPAAAATTLDGFPLTKQGKGLKAMGVGTISSMSGGVLSALALMFIAPPLARLSLMFSSLEYFFVTLFGITIIASVAGDSMAKGLMSGAFGLLIGTIGLDLMTGIPRFTFGVMQLESGVPLVPAMIGLFSIAQVLTSVEEMRKGKKSIVDRELLSLKGSVFPTRKEFRKITPTIGISSILGIIIGIIPAAGADIAAWISYNTAKKRSKTPEEFGKGAIEGIAACEAANNAAAGATLIPAFALGIPGGAVAAILLGGMMMHGLLPGHRLFTEQGAITYSILIGFLAANILMGVIGLAISKHTYKVSFLPSSILLPIIVGLSMVGAFAMNHSIIDVYIMLIFGAIGYALRKFGFAPAPVVLGMILGPIAETNWRQAIVLSRGDMLGYFFSRPISIALAILVVAAVLSPVIVKRMKKKSTE